MITKIALFLALLFLPFLKVEAEAPLTINLFSLKNGKGLEVSRLILKNELVALGHIVHERESHEKCGRQCSQADLNIYFESIDVSWIKNAPVNWFIPNPEWYLQDLSLLNQIDLILCRTHDVERIFHALGKRTSYIGFSSMDCYLPEVEKDYGLFVHVAGGSPYKGTKAILQAWSENGLPYRLSVLVQHRAIHSNLPHVNLVKKKLSQEHLRLLQNGSGVHLCPSEAEGYGHYLMEALSTGAVVITTDAPPMNEFIGDSRCLVPYVTSMPCHLGMRYFVDPGQLAEKVEALMQLTCEELKGIGDLNRATYHHKREEFQQNLKQLMLSEFP